MRYTTRKCPRRARRKETIGNKNANKRLSIFGRIAKYLSGFFSAHTAANIPSGFTGTYTNTTFRFAFSYPPDLRVEAWQEGVVTTVRGRNAARTIGFQISIRPIAGTDTTITAARVARDMPRVKVRAPETLRIRGAGTGLTFYASERTFGFGIVIVTFVITLAVPTVIRLIAVRPDTAVPRTPRQGTNQVPHTSPAAASSTRQ